MANNSYLSALVPYGRNRTNRGAEKNPLRDPSVWNSPTSILKLRVRSSSSSRHVDTTRHTQHEVDHISNRAMKLLVSHTHNRRTDTPLILQTRLNDIKYIIPILINLYDTKKRRIGWNYRQYKVTEILYDSNQLFIRYMTQIRQVWNCELWKLANQDGGWGCRHHIRTTGSKQRAQIHTQQTAHIIWT